MEKYIPYILSAWLIIGFTFLVPAKVFSQTNSKSTSNNITPSSGGASQTVRGITPGRARSLAGVVVCLVSLVIAWRAKKRSNGGTDNGRTGAIVALVLGIIGIILSAVHLGITAGAVFGSGSGKAGAIFGLVLGLIAITLSGLSLRSHKIG